MKRLIIVGAGGFGREVLAWARDCEQAGAEWRVGGFLDDDPNVLESFDTGVPLLGTIDEYQPSEGDVFVTAFGSPSVKRACVEKLNKNAVFVNVIHPTVVIGPRVTLGVGIVICPYCVLTTDIDVGDHTALNIRCSIGHDASIGRCCQLSSFCDVTGGVTLEDDVFLGSHVSVLPRVVVERGAIIGAGSVAISRVKAETTVMGVPARVLKS